MVLIINIKVILNTCIINYKLILENSRKNSHQSFTYRCYLLRLLKPIERKTKVSISLKYFCKKNIQTKKFLQVNTVISKKYDQLVNWSYEYMKIIYENCRVKNIIWQKIIAVIFFHIILQPAVLIYDFHIFVTLSSSFHRFIMN